MRRNKQWWIDCSKKIFPFPSLSISSLIIVKFYISTRFVKAEQTNIFCSVGCMKLKHIFTKRWRTRGMAVTDDQQGYVVKKFTCIFKKSLQANTNENIFFVLSGFKLFSTIFISMEMLLCFQLTPVCLAVYFPAVSASQVGTYNVSFIMIFFSCHRSYTFSIAYEMNI